jgi:Coenzyme PQQ synthesis protein D (PqqD)
MSSGLPAKVTIPDSVLWQQVGDEIVLLDVTGGEYHGLNDVGSRMWRALDQRPDVAGAYEELLATYEVDPDVLRADLHEFIAQLLELGLLSSP